MSDSIIKREQVDFEKNEFYVLLDLLADENSKGIILNHWHEEMEIAYIVRNSCKHYIDGVCHQSKSGDIIVTNSNSIHNIVPEIEGHYDNLTNAIVLFINKGFLEENIPNFENIYFTNVNKNNREDIKNIILEFYNLSLVDEKSINTPLYIKSLLLKLIYLLLEEKTENRAVVMPINIEKNILRVKGVIQHIENNYKTKMRQEDVAKKFYFSPEYFSRYFKKATGMTFTEYLTKYRLKNAVDELLKSDKTVTEIALNNGFTDDRRFILAFKKYYETTPLQFRKKHIK